MASSEFSLTLDIDACVMFDVGIALNFCLAMIFWVHIIGAPMAIIPKHMQIRIQSFLQEWKSNLNI